VLASRSDPPLPLARLRAARQLAELRADDLRFTVGEAAALLHEAIGAELPGAAVAVLEARTEGWVAGLQLAALSLRGQPDPAGFVAAFSGSHRYVLDYLGQEVLDRQEAGLFGPLGDRMERRISTSMKRYLENTAARPVTGPNLSPVTASRAGHARRKARTRCQESAAAAGW
jgi:hypothetical protein